MLECALAMVLTASVPESRPEDVEWLLDDFTAVERVYYRYRPGIKPPFDTAVPPETVRRNVEALLRKVRALREVYGVTVTEAQLEAELARLDRTAREPAEWDDVKAALFNNRFRMRTTLAWPIVVDRELRRRFAADEKIHAGARARAERLREALVNARESGQTAADACAAVERQTGAAARRGAGPVPEAAAAQLRRPGDVSAVIEGPAEFALYVATGQAAGALSAAVFTAPKLGLDEWLAAREPAGHALPVDPLPPPR